MTAFNWRLSAACRDEDPRLFFHETGEPQRFRELRETRAKAICAGCPARQPCLNFALRLSLLGIWGGLDERERAGTAAELGIPRLCPSGEHQMTGGNVYVKPDGCQVCRACRAAADRRDRARRAEARRLQEAAA